MAINYEPVGWDTTKHFNPTNMNHMDGGIKAACDKVDEHDSEIAEINSNLDASLENYNNTYADFCVEKRCGICQIMFNCTVESNIIADAWEKIATVNTAYRPRTNWVDMKISKLGVKYGIMVETNGNVYIMPIGTQISAGDYLIASMSYVSSTF